MTDFWLGQLGDSGAIPEGREYRMGKRELRSWLIQFISLILTNLIHIRQKG